MAEPYPGNSGDHAPQPLTPEQERVNQAGMVYARYLCARLEGELDPPEGYFRVALRNDATPEYMLTAVGNDRSIKFHTAPDDAGRSREITYNTQVTDIGYTGMPTDTIHVQYGSPTEGSSPPEPLSPADLDFLDGFLARKLPIPEVIGAVRAQVQAIMNPQPPNA